MTYPEYLGALAILCFLLCFGFYVWEDLAGLRRREAARYTREWVTARSRPFDREQDAA